MHSNRAQSSFEILIIISTVLMITSVVIANYISVNETTIALAIAKQSITEKLSKQQTPYTIKDLNWQSCGTKLNIKTNTIPPTLTSTAFDQGAAANIFKVQQDINSQTSFQTINLSFNTEALASCP